MQGYFLLLAPTVNANRSTLLAAAIKDDLHAGSYVPRLIATISPGIDWLVSATLAAFPPLDFGSCLGVIVAVTPSAYEGRINSKTILEANTALATARKLAAFWNVSLTRFSCESLPVPLHSLGTDPTYVAMKMLGDALRRFRAAPTYKVDRVEGTNQLAELLRVSLVDKETGRRLSVYNPLDLPLLIAAKDDARRKHAIVSAHAKTRSAEPATPAPVRKLRTAR